MKNIKINKIIFPIVVLLLTLLTGVLFLTAFEKPEEKTYGVTGTIRVYPKIYWINNPTSWPAKSEYDSNTYLPYIYRNMTLSTGQYKNKNGTVLYSDNEHYIGEMEVDSFDASGCSSQKGASINERGKSYYADFNGDDSYAEYVWSGSSKRTITINASAFCSGGFAVSGITVGDSEFNLENSASIFNFQFKDWVDDAEFSMSVDPTIFSSKTTTKYVYAIFAPKKVNICYRLNDGETHSDGSTGNKYVGTVFGENYSTPGTPTRKHYTFEKWYAYYYSSSSKYLDVSNSVLFTDSNLVNIYASWNGNIETITLNKNGGSGGTSSFSVRWNNTYTSNIDIPNRPGYTFLGYFDSASGGTQYIDTSGKMTKTHNLENPTLYAQWQANTYTVTASANSGYFTSYGDWTSPSNGQKVITYDTYYGNFPGVARRGYYLDGWFTASSGGSRLYTNTKMNTSTNHTIYAHWNQNNYKITMDYNGGRLDNSPSRSTDFKYGNTYSFPTPIKTGYTLSGWYCNYTGVTSSCTSQKLSYSVPYLGENDNEITFSARWTPNYYTLTADMNLSGASFGTLPSGWSGSGSTRTKSVAYDSSFGTLPTVSRTGYTPLGWYDAASGGSAVSSSTIMNSVDGRKIYQHWQINSYTLTLNPNNGSLSSTSGWTVSGNNLTKSYVYNTSYGTLPTPTRTGYIFKGWYSASSGGSSISSSNAMGAGNTTIYAQWEPTWAANATSLSLSNLQGSGTEASPHLIESETQLALLALKSSQGEKFRNTHFKQMKNLDFSGKTWLPIGSSTYPFEGSFDGNGYLIKNINTISTGSVNYSNVGLFGYTNNATLKNINIISGNITGSSSVGSIVGNMNYGSLTGSRSGAVVKGTTYCGLVGYGTGVTITSCYNYGNITGSDYVGGILGYANTAKATIENCYVKCNVSATASNSDCGGILGRSNVSGTTIKACGVTGKISGGTYAGLIAGSMGSGYISNSFVNSTATSSLAFYKSGATVTSSIYTIEGGVKKYIGSDFSSWSVTASGTPLPSGFSWLGKGGQQLTISILQSLGFTA